MNPVFRVLNIPEHHRVPQRPHGWFLDHRICRVQGRIRTRMRNNARCASRWRPYASTHVPRCDCELASDRPQSLEINDFRGSAVDTHEAPKLCNAAGIALRATKDVRAHRPIRHFVRGDCFKVPAQAMRAAPNFRLCREFRSICSPQKRGFTVHRLAPSFIF